MSKRKSDFSAVEFKKETTVKGGLLSKPCTLPTLAVAIGEVSMEFVNLSKRQDWLCKMVTGQGSWQRPLNRVKLIETLLRKMRSALSVEGEDDGAVGSDGEENVSAIDDPMASLAFEDDEMLKQKDNPSKLRRHKKTKKNVLLRLRMPREAPEKNPACAQTYEVRVWPANLNSVYICIEDLPWAVAFMHDQYSLGGVSTVVDEEVQSASPVKSKNVRWDFNSDCWVATVETGSSSKERRIKPSQLHLQEVSPFLEPSVSLSSMGYEEKKRIAYEVLTAWLEQHDPTAN